MIRVVYDPLHHRLQLRGHAGYPAKGIDPICCAASVLCYTLAENVQHVEPEAQILLRRGYARIQCRKTDADSMFVFCYRGLARLAEQYPDHIRCTCLHRKEDL